MNSKINDDQLMLDLYQKMCLVKDGWGLILTNTNYK